MAKTYIKFPTSFFTTKEWNKPRRFSKAEALLYILSEGDEHPIRELASVWQWSKSAVSIFLHDMQEQKVFGQKVDKKVDKKNADTEQGVNELQRSKRKKVDKKVDKKWTNEEPYLIVDNNYPPSILSISKDISNIHIPPKGETSLFANFQKWILANAPRVARMKEPFTEAQYLALKDEFDTTFICDLLTEMHNYQPLLKKNQSAYLTFRNWARRRNKWDNNEKSKRTTNTAGNAEPDEILRAVAEGIARSRTQQEWQS